MTAIGIRVSPALVALDAHSKGGRPAARHSASSILVRSFAAEQRNGTYTVELVGPMSSAGGRHDL